MRDDVFKIYYATMVKIINYKEIDKNGNERNCTVPIEEAKKHPDKYRIIEFKHPNLSKNQFAYDIELVKKFTNTFKKLCGILPQKKLGLSYDIHQKDLINAATNDPKALREAMIAETFFAMATECNIMKSYSRSKTNSKTVFGTINGVIPTTYKELEDDSKNR